MTSSRAVVLLIIPVALVVTTGILFTVPTTETSNSTDHRMAVRPDTPDSIDRGVARSRATAHLRGVIRDTEGRPIRRALVSIKGRTRRDMLTSSTGEYDFAGVLPGPYTLSAGKAGFTRLEFGQLTPFGLARRVSLRDGERIGDLDFVLHRTGRIRGVVLDESGYPSGGATVRLFRFHYVAGRKSLTTVNDVKPVETSDRGEFVVPDVPSGEYLLGATMPGAFSDGRALLGYAASYAPGTLVPEQAQRISVRAPRDSFARIRLQAVPVVHVSGSVRTSDGRPGQGVARLNGNDSEAPVQIAPVAPDGSFSFDLAVRPDEYELLASTGGAVVSPTHSALEMSRTRVTIGARQSPELALTTEPGGTIAGVVVSDTGQPVFGIPIRVFTYQVDSHGKASTGAMSVAVSERGRFEVGNAFWTNVIVTDVNPRTGWQLRGVYLNARDITDSGVTVRPRERVEPVSIVLTRNVTRIYGHVRDAGGRAIRDSTVLVFADSPEKWRDPLGRYGVLTRSESDGAYSVDGLPRGQYRMIALRSALADEGNDPRALERLRPRAQRVDLGDGGARLIDLKITSR